MTYTVEQGLRFDWGSQLAGNVRALESPNQSERRASGWYHATQTRIRLNFTSAYSGTLHLYAVDHWLFLPGRRENVTVDDGSGPRTAMLSTDFSNGAWMHFPITVAAGGSVTIKVDKVVGDNGVLAGLFLGGAGTPPPSPLQPHGRPDPAFRATGSAFTASTATSSAAGTPGPATSSACPPG